MLITDAVNKVIDSPGTDIAVTVDGNIVILRDEFGEARNFFSESDPEILQKMRTFWGEFLLKRSKRLIEKMREPRTPPVAKRRVFDMWDAQPTDVKGITCRRKYNTQEDLLDDVSSFITEVGPGGFISMASGMNMADIITPIIVWYWGQS